MKFISTWSVRPGCMDEAAKRFLAGKGQPPAGIKLLGRWHSTDLSAGWSLSESNDPAAMYAYSAEWSDLIELNVAPVVEDEAAGAALAKRYGKKKKH